MPTIEDLQQLRWSAIVANIPWDPSHAIPQFWLQHPELGSPLSAETGLDDGSTAQVFANGIVQWTPENGATLA